MRLLRCDCRGCRCNRIKLTPRPPSPQQSSTMTDMTEFTPAFFDAASAAWHANKIRRGPALAYKCDALKKDGATCTKPALSRCSLATHHLCASHHRHPPAHFRAPPPTGSPQEEVPAHESAALATCPQEPVVSGTSSAIQTEAPSVHRRILRSGTVVPTVVPLLPARRR